MSYRTKWTIGMSVLGVAAAVIAYLATDSWWWALGALLGSGIVVNAIVSARAGNRPRT